MVKSSTIFQQLLHKFQQLNINDNKHQDRFSQLILLCNELIENIPKITVADNNDFRDCVQLFYNEILEFESNIRIEDTKRISRDIFFAILDLLSKSQISTYLNGDEYTVTEHTVFYKCVTDLLLSYATSRLQNISFVNSDIGIRKYTDLFRTIYKRVVRDLEFRIQIKQEVIHDNTTTDYILSFLWNLSASIDIVPWLLGIDLAKSMLKCLKIIKPSSKIAQQIASIIHNISRHDDGTNELKQVNGLQILKDFQSNTTEKLDDVADLVTSMAIAQLSTAEQIRSDHKRMNRTLNQLLQITIDAAKDEHHQAEGFQLSEPLAVFTKLFVDDHSLEYVLNHAETDPQLTTSSTIALFVNLFIKYRDSFASEDWSKQFTCTALLNILWSISFQDRYKTKLKQNQDFLTAIKSLAMNDSEKIFNKYVSSSMESAANAANGILYNLGEISDTQLVSNAVSKKPTIMISYAHDNNQFCDKILTEFEKKRNLFEIWIDRDHCSSSEDLWEKIARGIGQSKVIVCLLSQEYFNSKSCRKEATFAIKRNKSIIPVYIGEPGDCDWLDIHIAGLKYVRFKGDKTELDRNKIQEMLRTIEATINETTTESLEQHTIPTQSRKETEKNKLTTLDINKAPEEWTSDDIQKWFSDYKVPDTLVKLFDFQSIAEMYRYASKLHVDSRNEFVKYRQRYAKQYPGDELEEYIFDRFQNALFKLPKNQLETKKISTSTPKSSTCTIS
ncbi:unnamed protein product [Adineta steineri]|uniref:TIR domain-containing protein n=1 Tax=Adineta steineri TaxID=433720 RepID=A0A816DRL3_9BILA|nr:unnamed protein product [Adineta steineri]CAF1639444.1 unnamed protein product [Adineta steineri]